MDYEIVDITTGLVVNSIAWDGESGNPVPENCIAVSRDYAQGSGIGWSYQNGEFVRPAPFTPPPKPIPSVVSRFQARAALVQAGHFEQVDSYMVGLPRTDIRRMAWEDAEGFDRSSTTLQAVATMLDLDESELDALFLLAASIEA